jgi:hypothetical protein
MEAASKKLFFILISYTEILGFIGLQDAVG